MAFRFDRRREISPCQNLPVLYLTHKHPTLVKTISENQLLPDSISFSSNPQVIRRSHYNLPVRASICLSAYFTLPWVAHLASGPTHTTIISRYSHSVSLGLHGFTPLSQLYVDSLAHSSIGTQSRCKHLFYSL